eukprot:7898061-Pyramimonas_sp.AAC.1
MVIIATRRLGGESDVKRRPFRFGFGFRVRAVRDVRACGRGEAAWAGERQSSCDWAAAGPNVSPLAAGGPRCPAGVPL